MMHDTLTCDHPQCHGLTNFLTQDEQLRVDFENGDKVRVGIIKLGSYVKKLRDAGHRPSKIDKYGRGFSDNNWSDIKRKEYMKKYNAIQYEKRRQWGLKGRYIAMRNKAFAYTWTLQIEWLLK